MMFVVGGVVVGTVSAREEAAFFWGYGRAEIDAEALAYYRYAWAVQDVGGFAERVFRMPDLGEEARRHAVQLIRGLFGPGRIVDAALQSPI